MNESRIFVALKVRSEHQASAPSHLHTRRTDLKMYVPSKRGTKVPSKRGSQRVKVMTQIFRSRRIREDSKPQTASSLHASISAWILLSSLVFASAVTDVTETYERRYLLEQDLRIINAGLTTRPILVRGFFEHKFDYVQHDGRRVTLQYRARKSERLWNLNSETHTVHDVTCEDGNVVEISLLGPESTLEWISDSTGENSTIFFDNGSLECLDVTGKPSKILHKLVKPPTLVSKKLLDDTKSENSFVYSLLAIPAASFDAFDYLQLRYYHGKQDHATIREVLERAVQDTPSEDSDGPDMPASSNEINMANLSLSSEKTFHKIADLGTSSSQSSVADERNMSTTTTDRSIVSEKNPKPEPDVKQGTTRKDFIRILTGAITEERALNSAAANDSVGRKLLSYSYSCYDQSCPSGEYRSSWEYGSSCCSDNWGTCNWYAAGTEYRPDCTSCHSGLSQSLSAHPNGGSHKTRTLWV